jgi:hypothetical protein
MKYNNQTQTNYSTPKRTAKPLTDYSPALALTRTRFYLNVMEAHFAELGVLLEDAKANGKTTIPNPFRNKNVARREGNELSEEDERT